MTLNELIEELQFIKKQKTINGEKDVVLYDPYIGEAKNINCLTIGSLTGTITIWAEE